MKRVHITTTLHGTPDKDGRVSFDLIWTGLDGSKHMQTYFADPAVTVKRLRSNIAEYYWFNKRRIRRFTGARNA